MTANSSYYIAQNAKTGAAYWWTMSPFDWNNNIASVFNVGGSSSGRLDSDFVNNPNGVRSVVSLKSCVLYSGGNGTASDPYTVKLTDTCSTVEN